MSAAPDYAELVRRLRGSYEWCVATGKSGRPSTSELAEAADTIEALAARVASMIEDTARMDWLEGEVAREIAALERDHFHAPSPEALFRRCEPITRQSIDAARLRAEEAKRE